MFVFLLEKRTKFWQCHFLLVNFHLRGGLHFSRYFISLIEGISKGLIECPYKSEILFPNKTLFFQEIFHMLPTIFP